MRRRCADIRRLGWFNLWAVVCASLVCKLLGPVCLDSVCCLWATVWGLEIMLALPLAQLRASGLDFWLVVRCLAGWLAGWLPGCALLAGLCLFGLLGLLGLTGCLAGWVAGWAGLDWVVLG